LLLLIPVFFGLGWLTARVDIRQLLHESRRLPRSYFRGLNFLLNEQPDEAVEAFQEALKADNQTVELHFALGSLFRRRGETGRAIRIHQELVEREDLGQDLRLQSLFELGLDYQKSGFLDRAEGCFTKLESSALADEARQRLLTIYQQEKNWQKAISLARSMDSMHSARDVAQYYCELASAEMMYSRLGNASKHLALALKENKKCTRASLLEGDLSLQAGHATANIETAIASWTRIEQQDPAYLSLVAKRLLNAYCQLGRQEVGMNLLRGFLSCYPSLDLLEVVYQLELEMAGKDSAYRLVRDELQRHPTLLGLERLLTARLPVVQPESRPDVDLALSVVRGYTERLARYRCNYCGFKAQQFYWCCPACARWETYPPKKSESFDAQRAPH